MTLPPDPEPDPPSAAEPGGGVSPGATPPVEGSATQGLAHQETTPSPRWVNTLVFVLMVVLLVLVLGFVVTHLIAFIRGL
ncbi:MULTISPECIES: DUF6480 family protein [Actinoalloteichus]|uniref:Uncharacterized protein n=1 Tax=Actinoalloteichus fjordicus TaxID=1612552 RepID=A0AAC9PRS5_9PSEU|nr:MULTISPECIES: DUF6480 family protein [Actinoalloteichus]APU14408.1 hypothetical protein UA74_11740 [Actinoalloteichus fjordicus]APU20377.1 hypothetical protein UA75_11825 [Actinoalloteichus sp. GBA129-24]